VFWTGQFATAGPVGTAFTYQGRLIDANVAADGLYDFQFRLFDANSDGNQVGSDVNVAEVDVIDGYFTVTLDFNSINAFNGEGRWLDIGVRPGDLDDPNAYTVLSPRQAITPTPYALYVAGGGESLWQVNGSDIYYNSGNVGIGTTTPSSPLTIKTVAGPDIEFVSTGSNADIMTNGAFRVGTSTGQPFSIITNNLYQMTVDSTGNVGIGTMSPEKKLDIAGESYTGLGIGLTNNSPGGTSWDIDNDGGIFKIVEHAGCGPEFLNNPRIAVVGNCIGSPYGGNVGIGTTSPLEKLHIDGNLCFTEKEVTRTIYVEKSDGVDERGCDLEIYAGECNAQIIETLSGGDLKLHGGRGEGIAGGNVYIYGGEFGTSPVGNVILAHNGTDAGGNVGIGTTSPLAKLDVNGDVNSASVYKIGDTVLSVAGAYNTLVGVGAGAVNTGERNTFSGYWAGYSNTNGSYNTFSGTNAGQSNTTGNNNTFLGYHAGGSTNTGSGNVFLGYYAGHNETGSNKLYIANSDVNNLICGDFSARNVGINTTTPARNLHINDVMRLQPRATAPSSPSEGDIYYSSTSHSLMVYNGTTWMPCF
jgi:hypothetical protein